MGETIATMTTDEFRQHFDRLLEIRLEVARAEGRLQGLEEAMKAMCQGCDKGWPFFPELFKVPRHRKPNRQPMKCQAQPIRALKDKEPEDAE